MKTTIRIIMQISLFFLPEYSFCNNYDHQFGARSSGISGASVTYTDIWSLSYNQAGLAYLKHFSAGVNYENRFLVSELSIKSLVLALPSKSGVFGLSFYYYGFSDYNEDKIGFAYSKTLGKYFSLGIQFDYFYTHIAEQYGSTGVVSCEAGLRIQPVKNLFIGIHIFNPTYSKITNVNNEKIPTTFKTGIGYDFSGKVYLSIELEKDLDNVPKFKSGVEYRVSKNLFLRTGLTARPEASSFGFGYYFNNINIDLSFSASTAPGMTSSASVYFEF